MTYEDVSYGPLLNSSSQPIEVWITTYSYHYINYIGLRYFFFSPRVPSYGAGNAIDENTSIPMSSIYDDIGITNIKLSLSYELWSVVRRRG